ncbi:ankyrin repeat-containing domain protein [Diplogelasinospora grovesii]|uniref:Ankyrin repeat-containing domain protein n=1 Tax=Diplogelasinospora grovesii TaxID=303347 RepID=A0AAN6MZB4_9PEZI|nr:ankyrin repeat-containing domain protein [Diplogelasinospora grovesii]
MGLRIHVSEGEALRLLMTLPGTWTLISEAETRKTVSAWLLGGYTPNDLYENSAQKRLNGTYDWIFDRPEFRSWIYGPAGFGKTILCSRVVEHLPSEIGAPIAHFFFSSDYESREDPYIAIRSWIFQVISHPKAFDVDRSLHGKDSVGAFLNTITKAVAETKTRVMIVSRDEPGIRRGLPSYVSEYRILSEDVRPDTESYARTVIDRKLSKKSEAIKNGLALRMADRCNGQFLWLKMQEGSLDSWMSKKALTEVINETPAGLEHLYDRNWDDILRFPHLKRSRAIDLLRWAAFALRPLTVYEMTEALLINDECDDLPVNEIPNIIDEDFVGSGIIGLCGSLLKVRSNSSEPDIGHRTVHLAHFSVRQYFVSKMSAPGSFRDYAAGSWHQHVVACEPIDAETVDLMNALFDSSNPNGDAWRTWFDQNDAELNTAEGENAVRTASPLYYASLLGLVGIVRHLLRGPKHIVMEKASSGRTALGAAYIKGHMAIVDMLLQAGASIAERDNVGRTALYLAAWNGRYSLLKLLLERGADLTIPNNYRWTPLNSASDSGHVEVVKLLLEQGADVTVASTEGWTPLNSASHSGHVEVVKLLLEKGADVTVITKGGWTPLNLASHSGHVEVVKLLLEKGADVTVANKNGWTPLNSASNSRHVEVVKLLLRGGEASSSRW